MADPYVAGYILASTNPRIEGPDAQREAIENYCRLVGMELSGVYIDPPSGGMLPIHRREAGRRLEEDLRRGSHVVVARLDRIAEDFLETALTLASWSRRGITAHLVDIEGGLIDPGSPQGRALAEALVAFARAGRSMTGIRAREKIADLKKEGKRYSRHAPFGSRWEKRRGETRMVPDEAEQTILRRVGELWLEGHSIDSIRQYLAYTWRVRNRNGREFGPTEIKRMTVRGAREVVKAGVVELPASGPAENGTRGQEHAPA